MPFTIIRTLSYHLLLTVFLITGACSKEEEAQAPVPDKIFHHTIFTFGTLVDVSIYGVSEKDAELAFEALEKDFHYMHTTWHPWQQSALARVNLLLATGEKFSIAPSIRPLVERSITLTENSEGLFDPAIGKLIRLWSFHKGERDSQPAPPDPKEIQKLLASGPSMLDIELQGITIHSKNPDVLMDFGGFAKGYGIDKAMDLLQGMGIRNAIINAGGDLRAIGKNGDRPWRIGIRHPREKGAMASIEIEGDMSVFTSGDYERYFEYQGKRYHHIIDPRTGYPATETMSVTVVHDNDAATADAAATALFVAGPKDWHRIAKSMGIKQVLLMDKEGAIYMNPGMKERVRFLSPPKKLVISKPLS